MKTKTQTSSARKNKIIEIKKTQEENQSKVFKELKLFWAFWNDQFDEWMKKNNITWKVTSIWWGWYLPSENVEKFISENKRLDKEYKKEMKEYKEELIKYELANYECFYTWDVTPVVECLKWIATRKQIEKVFTNK